MFEALRAAPTRTYRVVFDAISVTHIDTAGLEALSDLSRRLEAAGIELRIAAIKDYLFEGFNVTGIADDLGPEHFYPTLGAAVRSDALASR